MAHQCGSSCAAYRANDTLRSGGVDLIEFHEERNLDLILLTIALSLAGRIGERRGKGSLHGTTQVPRRDAARTHVAKRAVRIDRREDRALNAVNTCLVHLPRRR